MSFELVSGLLDRNLSVVDYGSSNEGNRIVRCQWHDHGMVIVRESLEGDIDTQLTQALKLFKSKLHSFNWYIQTMHFHFTLGLRTYVAYEYHPLSLRNFLDRATTLPLRLIAKMFAAIVRGAYAFNLNNIPLTRLSPSFIGVTKGLIPKIGSSKFSFNNDALDDPLYM